MRTRVIVLTVLVGLALVPRVSSAHHQLDKTYVRDRTIVLSLENEPDPWRAVCKPLNGGIFQ